MRKQFWTAESVRTILSLSLSLRDRWRRMSGPIMLAAVLALLAVLPASPARAQNPVPLPTDSNLAAYVGISGTFRNITFNSTQNLALTAWAAAFGPNETFDFGALDSRAFLTPTLPDGQGWAFFESVDPTLTITINVTDAANRLGSVKVYEIDSGQLVSTIQANAQHSQAQSTLQRDSEIRNYRLEILDTNGALLSSLAADLGKWDKVVPVALSGGFEPYYPTPVASAHYTPGPSDVGGTEGDPKAAPGALSAVFGPGFSKSACALDYTNDVAQAHSLSPPDSFAQYVKRQLLPPPFNINRFPTGDPTDYQNLQGIINAASVQDFTRALSTIDIPPYADATALWHIEFRGAATAVLAVPFERKRKTTGLGVLVQGIVTTLIPARNFLSILAAAAGNSWLSDQANQQSSGFKQYDVMPWGDIYALIASEADKNLVRLAPIMAPVTFVLQPDIPPPSGAGMGTVSNDGAATSPAPPPPAVGGNLFFSSTGNPPYTCTLTLAKGWKWKVTGYMQSPLGYQAVDQPISIQTPDTDAVNIPVHLAVLLTLKVYTESGGNPVAAMVTIKDQAGQVRATGMSVMNPVTNKCTFVATQLPPGTYSVNAHFGSSGGTYDGTSQLQVQVGILQELTVPMTFTPPPHH